MDPLEKLRRQQQVIIGRYSYMAGMLAREVARLTGREYQEVMAEALTTALEKEE